MSDAFRRIDGRLFCEDVPLSDLARRFDTPLYVYSARALEENFRAWPIKAPDLVCYAVKANGTLGVLERLAHLGSGFDIVSEGELLRALAAGADPRRIVFSGVGKTRRAIATALEADIGCFNVESLPELERIESVARSLGRRARVSVRVNPDVDPHTNARIATGLKSAKFGVPLGDVIAAYQLAASLPHLDVTGISCHIGSQIQETGPYLEMADQLFSIIGKLTLHGIRLEHIDFGGGAGVAYAPGERALDPAALVAALKERMKGTVAEGLAVWFEPGRSIVADAGALLTRVEYVKRMAAERDAVIVDASMTEFIRPTLYDAWHAIEPVEAPRTEGVRRVDVVGPVCESSDWLGHDRLLAVAENDVLAVRMTGAYGMSMASTYNARPLPLEVMVDGSDVHALRDRPDVIDAIRTEKCLLARPAGALSEVDWERLLAARTKAL